MKKVLLTFSHVSLITLMFLLTPYAKANMDNICLTAYEDSKDISEYIAENCERNNILQIRAVPYTGKDINLIVKNADFLTKNASEKRLLRLSNYFCRFDRNRDINHNTLSCVLYSPEAREFVKQN